MDLGLEGRVALVLASSQGLGKASALALAREGANLVICARREDLLQATQQEIQQQTGRHVLAVPTDITVPEQVKRLVQVAFSEFGRIDILITNSGPPANGLFMQLGNGDWQAAVDGMLMSVVNACREVIPIMQKQKWGRIVHITSTSIKQPLGHMMLSSSVRMSVAGLAKVMANQFAADGILIHCICPGPFLTEAEAAFFERIAKEKQITPEEAQKGWLSDIPMGRIGDPREFGDVVAFLASERSSYMTGTAIQVDGGRVQSMV